MTTNKLSKTSFCKQNVEKVLSLHRGEESSFIGTMGCAARKGVLFQTSSLAKGILFATLV